MKKLIILLLLVCNFVVAQQATNNTSKTELKRMQQKNSHNDKYTEKYNYNNNNQTIICESFRGKRNHCVAETRYGINFIRQISNSSCNQNWGYDQSGIWVNNGCRAEFSVNYGWDQSGSEGNIMVCESYRHKQNYCPAYLNGRDVFLLRQISNSSCVNNWGFDRNGVWVTNGCRAEFVVEDSHWTQNDVVVCSSRNSRFQSCPADTRGGVNFIRQISRASCNGNWGFDNVGIWVANGCRAKFKLMPYNQWDQGNNYSDTVKCSSRGLRRKTCQADTRGGVRLKKQHSNVSCRGNWGFDRSGVWVDNGCRATFQLNINGNSGHNNGNGNNNRHGNNRNNNNRHGNNNGYGNNNRVTCSSRKLKRTTCSIPNGAKVQLHKQLSRTSCSGKWGYNRREIWVSNGCRAEFNTF